jgi:diguanylate cyclase (GGDEF)-like protein
MTKLENVQAFREEVEALLEQAKDAEHRSSEESLELAQQALSIANEHQLTELMAACYVRIGRCNWINGNFEKAIEELNKAIDKSADSKSEAVKVEALIGLGNVHIHLEMFDQSLIYYNQALEIGTKYGYDELISKVLNNLGAIYEELKDIEEALKYYHKSLDKTTEINDAYGQAIANLNIGNMLFQLGDIKGARTYLKAAVNHAEDENKTLLLAHAHYTYGQIYQSQKDYEKSVELLLLGVEKATASKDLYILFRIYLSLAKSYQLMKQCDRAETVYKQAIDVAKNLKMDELKSNVYAQMARFYENNKLLDEALKYYQKYYTTNKSVKEKRINERKKIIAYQSKLSASIQETNIYRELTQELETNYRSMQILSEIGQTMTSTHEIDRIFNKLYDNINLLMTAETLTVALFDPKAQVLRVDLSIERGQYLDSNLLALDNKKSMMVWSFKNKQMVQLNDIEKDYKKYVEGVNTSRGDLMQSAMFAPLMVEGETIGVFSVQAPFKHAYTNNHKVLLQTLGSYLAISIKNATKTKELDKLNSMLKTKSEHDGLTGIPNRRLFDERFNEYWIQSIDSHENLGVMIIDIDDFKAFNDHYGHLVGDEVVKSVAQLLEEEKHDGDFVARYGGDEFTAIIQNATKEKIISYDKRVRKALHSINDKLGIKREVTVSIGAAFKSTTKHSDKSRLVYLADNQLYESKAKGKNTLSIKKV